MRQALKCHHRAEALLWLEHFRAHGSAPLPPRSATELEDAPGIFGIGPVERQWPWHSADHITRIDRRAREQFDIGEDVPVSSKRWRVAHHAYRQEIGLVPLPPAPKVRRTRKPGPHTAPHFQRHWPGHSAEFVAEIEARARLEFERRGLTPERAAETEITDGFFAYICHRETKED